MVFLPATILSLRRSKKKFDGIVYKRRIKGEFAEIQRFLSGDYLPLEDEQIQRESHWFLHRYPLAPKVFIGYDRAAFVDKNDPELRITFDQNIRWRRDRMDLRAGADGSPVLPEDGIVMEIKLSRAAPLWLVSLLSEFSIYPTSFSKYGTCYWRYLAKEIVTERKLQLC